jgi:hypothetical protein
VPKYLVELSDGRKFEVEADAPPSEQDVLAAIGRQPEVPQTAPSQPSRVDSLLADNPAAPWMTRAGLGLARIIKRNPVTAGAMAGGLLAAPLTGGASVPAAMAASGLGAAGGAGVGLIAEQVGTGKPRTAGDVARTMATEGALGAAGEGVGRLAGAGLKALGRGAYRVALAPTQATLGKYGDVVGEGLETATPVSIKGLGKATASKTARITTKKAALREADDRVSQSAGMIADDASRPLADYAAKQVRAGLPDPTPDIAERLAQFKAANPNGSLTPSSLDEVKSTLDDVSGGAHKKMRAREPLSGNEMATIEMTRSMSRANEAAVPGYRQMNREIMNAEGLRRAVERRTLGSGGNQVLDTLMMLMRGSAGIPARAAMMPSVMSSGAIGAYKAAPSAPALLKSAILGLLSPETPQDQ